MTNKELSNGVLISVEKTNNEHSNIGVFSKHNYGITHSFSYRLLIDDLDAEWNGESGEPKNILFCENSMFLMSYAERRFNNDSLRKIDTTLAYESHYETVKVCQKYVDKRYFFKLFGNEYWLDIPIEEYQSKKSVCKEFEVPNDGELSLSNFKE